MNLCFNDFRKNQTRLKFTQGSVTVSQNMANSLRVNTQLNNFLAQLTTIRWCYSKKNAWKRSNSD